MNSSTIQADAIPSGSTPSSARMAGEPKVKDSFYWLGEFNKASTVMVVEQGIVSRASGAAIAEGIAHVIAEGDKPGGARPGDYLPLEALLVAAAGPDVSRMHSGRSRQDMLATMNRVVLREQVLDMMQQFMEIRVRLCALSCQHVETIIPAYTNGVQAQPTTLAHYLLAFDAAFQRDSERLRAAYTRLNLSPLGAAALGTSSFPVNRPRLAELLGFDGMVDNSYDANMLSAMDTSLEVLNIVCGTALTIGALVEDITSQYRGTRPWMVLRTGELTGTSSIMPQKRNPYGLAVLRQAASTVIGECHLFVIQAHNLSPGMLDYKVGDGARGSQQPGQAARAMSVALDMAKKLTTLLDNLTIDPERAREEVDADYSTSTELADVLQRVFDVPFRIGHHFASELVNYGQRHGFRADKLPYSEARRIYAEATSAYGIDGTDFPMSEQQFRRSLCARNMVNSSLGHGGPQSGEVKRMLGVQREQFDKNQQWLSLQKYKLLAAAARLNEAFEGIRQHGFSKKM